MKRARWTGMAAATVLLVGAANAAADPIIILTNGLGPSATSRLTGVTAGIPGSGISQQSAFDRDRDALVSTVPFSAGGASGVGTATLTSSFADPLHWFGAATTGISFTAPADYTATSQFRAGFQVTSPVTYAFKSSLTAASSRTPAATGAPEFQSARSFALLGHVLGPGRDEDEPLAELLFNFSTPIGSGSVNSAISPSSGGLLMPGEYFLFAVADDHELSGARVRQVGAGNANFAFTLDFTPADSSPSPTPEPASLLLLGTAVAGVFGFRRRRSDCVQ